MDKSAEKMLVGSLLTANFITIAERMGMPVPSYVTISDSDGKPHLQFRNPEDVITWGLRFAYDCPAEFKPWTITENIPMGTRIWNQEILDVNLYCVEHI